MRLIPVLNMLGMACAACTAFAIIANGFQGYLPPGRPTALPFGLELYGQELVGRWLGIFVPSALFATAGFFVNRKNQAIRYPGLMTGVVVALLLSYVSWGTNVGSCPLARSLGDLPLMTRDTHNGSTWSYFKAWRYTSSWLAASWGSAAARGSLFG